MLNTSHSIDRTLAITRGMPLAEDAQLGALTLPALFLELTERYKPETVLTQENADGTITCWSYERLQQASIDIARALVAGGLGKGERVGILMTNRAEFLASVFGVALAGGVSAMLSTFSTLDELSYLLAQSGCSTLLFESTVGKQNFCSILHAIIPELEEPGPLHSSKLPFLRQVVCIDAPARGNMMCLKSFIESGQIIPPETVLVRAQATTPADPGVLFFSSGTTSKPKGILSSHRGVCIQMWRMQAQQGLPKGVRSWTANGFFWSGNFAMVVGATLVAGGTLILQSIFEPEHALHIISRGQAEFVFAWPHQWAQLINARNWLDVDLSSIRFIDPTCPLATHPTIKSDWIEPRHCYGNTETFTLVSGFPAGTTAEQANHSHGLPFPGNIIRIVDPLTGAPLHVGEHGEIAVKGPTLMLGYVGIPLDETLDDEGFLRTGDGGYIDNEGRLFWSGRLNDIIKTGGANVSPLEVDDVLRDIAGVKLAQTVGIPHDTLGEMVVSCIVPDGTHSLSEESVRTQARQRLASYKAPKRVLFFSETDIELTGTAKIKTAELRSRVINELANEHTIRQ